jgi:hypothetical protein
MRRPSLAIVLVVFGAGASIAHASPITLRGEVIGASSRWTSDGSRIVTDVVVRDASGIHAVVSQLGGHVDGLTMRSFPSPARLVPGMAATIDVSELPTARGAMVLAVDDVRVDRDVEHGFVRTGPTDFGHYLYWESGCVYVATADEGTNGTAGDAEFAAVEAAMQTWNDAIDGCSYMRFVSQGRQRREVGKDFVNLIKFRDVTWCRPAVDDDPARCHSPLAAGITTMVYVEDADSDRDGAIVDGDIELNNVDFAIAIDGVTQGMASCQSEIANTLTHELGHLLGLEHTCLAFSDPPRIDDEGNPVPTCSSTTEIEIVDATMYNFQDCGEIKKADLTPDDIDAVCSIYPTADDPGTCEPVEDPAAGCCGAGRGGSGAGALLLTLIVFVGLRRRVAI